MLTTITRSYTKSKAEQVHKQLLALSIYTQQQTKTYLNFMRHLSWCLYILNMQSSDRYTIEDIKSLNIELRWEDDVVIDSEEGCLYFYQHYVPVPEQKTQEEIHIILDKYTSDRERLFQMLYRKYIDPQYTLDNNSIILVV